MTMLEFQRSRTGVRLGFKGPAALEWLGAQGFAVPTAPNSWSGAGDEALLIARLGNSEFFLEEIPEGAALRSLLRGPQLPPGVYPVLREDAAFLLSGQDSLDVLAQICNVNFGDLALDTHPLVMTQMIGVSVLVVPQRVGAQRRYRIWCDPSFAHHLEHSVGTVVVECGGNYQEPV